MPPPNLDATSAVMITDFPYDITQDVHELGVTYTVWYGYTATLDGVVSVFPFGEASGYLPLLNVWTGDPNSPSVYLGIFNYPRKPTYFPVTNGENYFFQIVTPAGNPTPAMMTLHVELFTEDVIPEGAIIINDAATGWPAGLLSPTTGEPVSYIQDIVAGEAASIVNTGETIFQDVSTGNSVIYDSDFNLVATIAIGADVLGSNKVDKFYAGVSGTAPSTPSFVNSYNLSGVLQDSWTIPGNFALQAIAPSRADTILYHGEGGLTPQPINRWDLVNSVALSDLYAGEANYLLKELLVLGDDTIVAMFRHESILENLKVKRFDPDGTLLGELAIIDNAGVDPRIAWALDDPDSIWIWHKIDGGLSRFRNVLVSDGSTITEFEVFHFTSGSYDGDISATPEAYFGHSESCNFLILLADEPPVVDNTFSGVYKIVPGKRNDTLWENLDDATTRDVKIPNPTARLGFIGE